MCDCKKKKGSAKKQAPIKKAAPENKNSGKAPKNKGAK